MYRKYLKWVIFGGLFLIPFVPFLVDGSLYFPFITTKAFAWRIIVEIIFGAWIVLSTIEPKYRPRKSIILYALLAFTVVIGLANLFGVAPLKSFWSNYERMEGYITILHLGAFFLVIGSVFREGEWRKWFNTTLLASFIMVIYGFFQMAGVLEIHQGGTRVDGTLGNSAYLAVYLLFHIFFASVLFMREKKWSLLRWVYGILIILETIILYYTATRGTILGLLGGLLIVAILNIKNHEAEVVRKVSLAGVILFVVLVSGFFLMRNTKFIQSSYVLSRFSEISLAEIKTEGRSFVWPMAVKGVLEKPILGWGQDNFNYVFNEHYNPEMYRLEPWFDRAHNIFLDWAIAGGFLGLLAYLSLYVVLLISIWKKDKDFTHLDRSLLTGLIVAYFFHNLFVFDHLISYIFFISLLAYVHSRSTYQGEILDKTGDKDKSQTVVYSSAIMIVCLVGVLYVVNIKPYLGNQNLIYALRAVQGDTTEKQKVFGYLSTALNNSRLGKTEVVEWVVTSSEAVLSSDIPLQEKNNYFNFAKGSLENLLVELPTDARYQILAGTFFNKTGFPDEAIKHLKIAQTLIPGKQLVYFELGGSYLSKNDTTDALKTLKAAYDLAPGYSDAQIVYLVGAIYAGDIKTVNQLMAIIPEINIVTDDRIAGVYMNLKNYPALIELLKRRVVLVPNDPKSYISLAAAYVKVGDKGSAIQTLLKLGEALPGSKTQADQYIKGIQDGTLK